MKGTRMNRAKYAKAQKHDPKGHGRGDYPPAMKPLPRIADSVDLAFIDVAPPTLAVHRELPNGMSAEDVPAPGAGGIESALEGECRGQPAQCTHRFGHRWRRGQLFYREWLGEGMVGGTQQW